MSLLVFGVCDAYTPTIDQMIVGYSLIFWLPRLIIQSLVYAYGNKEGWLRIVGYIILYGVVSSYILFWLPIWGLDKGGLGLENSFIYSIFFAIIGVIVYIHSQYVLHDQYNITSRQIVMSHGILFGGLILLFLAVNLIN